MSEPLDPEREGAYTDSEIPGDPEPPVHIKGVEGDYADSELPVDAVVPKHRADESVPDDDERDLPPGERRVP
ncbi:hypothetical protein ACDF64_17835 [Agromyces sp. MMS24-JH15]|uniref:hypothetical protein n=1 Tax=Agromyces sp. MMS24-JH15 TaxID=3243765 RepID=UPI0037478A5F